MADFGLTAQGFKRKTYPDILESMKARARAFFGEDINLSDRSPLGLFMQTVAWDQAKLWEVAENVYYAGYIDDAEGVQLDSVVKYALRGRKGAVQSRGEIVITGEPGTLIERGFKVATKGGIVFETEDSADISEAGNITIGIVAIEPGLQGNVPAGTITEIVNPIAGAESATNLIPTAFGESVEADPALRERYYRSLSYGGSSTGGAVEAALLEIPTVRDAFVEENDTLETVNGLPPKCIAPYVFGGSDTEVATTILKKKAGGIRSYGNTEISVTDERGYEYAIGFTRPAQKDIYVRLQITKGPEYPGNGDDLVKTAVIKYIGGMDAEGVEYLGLRLGANVIRSKIVSAIDAIPGVNDTSIELSTDGATYAEQNIEIAQAEIAVTDPDKVVLA